MTIKIPENNLKGVQKWKNAEWENSGTTPNLLIDSSKEYSDYVTWFAAKNRIPGPYKFHEIRVVKQKPQLVFTPTRSWWDDPMFMDRIFWAFMKPVYEMIDGLPYSYYALEPKECVRVIKLGWSKFGIQPVSDLQAAFIIPVECCELAMNERAAGVSEHLHTHLIPIKVETQEEVDKRAQRDAEVARLSELITDISSDPNFEHGSNLLQERLRGGKS